jgi:hypothetical protein
MPITNYITIGGVPISGFISPGTTADDFPVIDTTLGIDGLRNYSGNTIEVLSGTTITELRRRAGMIVGVDGGDRYFKLKDKDPWDFDLTDWEELDFSGGGSGSAITGGTYSAGTLTLVNGSGGTITVSGFAQDNIYVTGGTVTTDGLLLLNWNDGGTANPIDLSDLIFTGNTSGNCITELWVKNISGCTGDDLHIGVESGRDIYFDSTGSTTSPSLFINSKGQIGVGTNDPFNWASNDGTGIEVHNDSINDQIPLAFTELGTRRFYFETDFANTSNPVHIKGSSGTNLITFNTSSSSSRVGVGTTVPDGTFQIAKAGTISNQTKYPDETNIVINNTSNGYSGTTNPNSAAFRFDHGSGEDPGGLITSTRLPVWDSGEKSTTLEIWNASGETLYKRIEIEPSWNTNIFGEISVKYDNNDNTRIRVTNLDTGVEARTSLSLIGIGLGGIETSGTITYIGKNYNSSGDFQGPYLPNSLNITTAGGSTPNRAHINIGSRSSTGETRFFSGGDDFDNTTLLGIFYPSGLTTTDTKIINTDKLRVRDGAVAGYVLTSDGSGNATWQSASGGGGSNPLTAYTYDGNSNTFSIGVSGSTDLTAQINEMSGLTINGDLIVNGESIFSGNSSDVVKIFGSGDTTPIFSVEGSVGELFTITDSLTGQLFGVNNVSGLPILEVYDDNTILMGDNLAPSLNTTVIEDVNSGQSTLYSIPTTGYTGAFFEYTVKNTGGVRAGSIMSVFSGTSIEFNETTTNDIGNTTDLTFDMNVTTTSDGNTANLLVSATTNNWEIKTIIRSI